jgi:hypothetical protein
MQDMGDSRDGRNNHICKGRSAGAHLGHPSLISRLRIHPAFHCCWSPAAQPGINFAKLPEFIVEAADGRLKRKTCPSW